MKILVTSYEYPPIGGGGAKVVYGLTSRLTELGHHIDLITMGYKNLPGLENKSNFNIHRMRCVRLKADICTPFEMLTYLVSAMLFIIKLCRKNNYDINHSHFIFPDGILAFITKKLFGLPYILTAHGSDVPGYNPNRFKFLHFFLSPLWKIIVNNSDEVICPSKTIRGLILKIDKGIKTQIIPNGINFKKFSNRKTKKKQILYVSRIFERKGVQYFLNALQKLDHCFEVNIVGDGPYLENLKRQSQFLNLNVNFLGSIDNDSPVLQTLFETSLIFVFTSESENFPIVLLEAMSAGLAIITTTATGCAEVVDDTALLVQPKNSASIREALLKLMNDPGLCSRLGSAARKRVEEKFGWETTADMHLKLYQRILS